MRRASTMLSARTVEIVRVVMLREAIPTILFIPSCYTHPCQEQVPACVQVILIVRNLLLAQLL